MISIDGFSGVDGDGVCDNDERQRSWMTMMSTMMNTSPSYTTH